MANSYQLNIAVHGVAQVQALTNQVRQLNQANQAGGRGGGAGGSSGGPLARLQAAQRALSQSPGSFDAQYRAAQAQKSFQRAQQVVNPQAQGPWKAALDALMTSRVGFGGRGGPQIMPLMNRLFRVFSASTGGGVGGGGAGGPVAIALMIFLASLKLCIEAFKSFMSALHASTEALKAFRDSALVSGGTTGNIAGLKAMGMDPASIPGAAAALRAKVAGGGVAAAYSVRLGGGMALPRPFGDPNEAGRLEANMKGIAKLATANERLQAAQALELQVYMPLIDAYRRHAGVIERDAALQKALNDDATTEAASDLIFQLGRLKDGFMELLMALTKPFLKSATQWIAGFADGLKGLASFFNTHQKLAKAVVMAFVPFTLQMEGLPKFLDEAAKGIIAFVQTVYDVLRFLNPTLPQQDFKGIYDGVKAAFKAANDMDALNANTQATIQNTTALQKGTFGGGDRTRRAAGQKIPGMQGDGALFDQAVRGGAYRLGAF